MASISETMRAMVLDAPGRLREAELPVAFPYELLWQERLLQSVANLTRKDATEVLALAPRVPIKTTVTSYLLDQVPRALADLRSDAFSGAAVIVP